ncbi:sulfurtransferase-like selenium metabolism protein YedF [Dethiosulfatarculus sandiegensis]|uniref:Selenium metabolism protein YedF n=1 Tax=Dethiosulfatarculus sandiegensis TaxID=1429043 RepID=A0A0D2HSX7_9BACT|nr:sulfurtransferase-like selenium metabolism protein YedF [Dethiosulfatarculus sandiegensis]KIX13648.1 selenium metabolism protein YedF [Dethiosulfatarculus sandiegensis]
MLDCRKMACPQPVIQTKNLVEAESPNSVEVMVDNKAASENVSRYLGTQGFSAEVSEKDGDFVVTGKRDGEAPMPEAKDQEQSAPAVGGDMTKQLVFIRSECIGSGDDKLGRGLMKNFILTLKEMGPDLWRVIFLNGGVKLCCQGSEVLEAIQELEKSGVHILVCGTCLDFFGILEEKRVGETTNMLDVVTSLQLAGKVITA